MFGIDAITWGRTIIKWCKIIVNGMKNVYLKGFR